MEFPVEATILVDHFQDQQEVQRLLRSHGFTVQDLGRGQVQIQGHFEHLRDLKVRLEQLLASERAAGGAASSSSLRHQDHRPPWSGASSSLRHQDHRPPWSGASSSLRHQDHRPPWSGARRVSRGEWTMVDSDVFRYARQLGNKELRDLLSRSDLQTRTSEDGLSTGIRFLGTRTMVGPLQNLLDDLNTSLRTQEVPLRDLDQQGRVLLRRIQEKRNVSESVLVCELEDRIHLIGPSKDSWELKQRLLGRPVHQSGARGRRDRDTSRWRSSSMGPAAGFSPSGPDPGRPQRTQSLSRSWDTGRPKQPRQKEKRSCSVL
ncbi:RNA-binding protein 43 [Austrofundulus limnaeus]|uniref:RNA-binding protein 43 n=1 Tax=Austrofundulus limnaeus TaxID=52670 RepID=A0A2I4CMC2_AUSLI|nr:PREDICTED: uncharacterized protein LOC106530107 [Austrofundulus limnaeus]